MHKWYCPYCETVFDVQSHLALNHCPMCGYVQLRLIPRWELVEQYVQRHSIALTQPVWVRCPDWTLVEYHQAEDMGVTDIVIATELGVPPTNWTPEYSCNTCKKPHGEPCGQLCPWEGGGE